eukprot:5684211-Amphidinium_carterae.1
MYMQKVSYICRLFHVIQCEGLKDWSFEIEGEVPSWDDHAYALEERYLKMITDSGFFEYACPTLTDVRALLRMETSDEPSGKIDPYLWDQIYDHYWSFPTNEFVRRPTLVIADSCLNHGGRSGANNLSGFMKQHSRKQFEFGMNSGGDATAIASSIVVNGNTNWNTRVDKQLMHGCMCNLIVLWMFNDSCGGPGGYTLKTRDEAVLRIHIEEGVEKIYRAIVDTKYTRVFVVCGGDALAWNMPPVWNKLADMAARRFRQNGIPAITGGAFFKKINMMGGNKQEWHLPRNDEVKMEVMNFLENISDLLHHFSFTSAQADKMWDMMEHSPTVAKAKAKCKKFDQVRERDRGRKEEELRKEKESRGKKAKEMKENEDELRSVIRKDANIQEQAMKQAKGFMNGNADSGMLTKHCETKITRAVGDKNALMYAKFTYILAIATDRNTDNLFDAEAEASADEGRQQGGLSGKTTPQGDERMYLSKYIKKYPPESVMSQQVVEVYGNGSESQYIGTFPAGVVMSDWMRRFSDKQLRIKVANAQLVFSEKLDKTNKYVPEIPSGLLTTMGEVELGYALNGFNVMDNKSRRITGLNFEDPQGANKYEYGKYIDVVVRPVLGDKQGVDAAEGTFLHNISKNLTGHGRHNGVDDGWIDISNASHGHSSRNLLLAMIQGEKPRYEIRIINNPTGESQYDDLDIKILKYRMLQGHFSRMQRDGEAIGTLPKAISRLIRITAEEPGDTVVKMRYGYHATSLPLSALDNLTEKGIVPGGSNEGDWVVRDSVHMCPLHPTHNDAIGIWSLCRPAKERQKYDGPTTQIIFVVDLLMLQEEYDVGIYQARSGNFLIPSVVPWNCVCKVINSRGTIVDVWHARVLYGQMDASIDAERLRSERQKKRTKTADPDFKKKRSDMESDEFANMFSNAASSQRPMPKPAPGQPKGPPPKMPPQGD